MQILRSGRNSSPHAITDLYDPDRRALLIQYPIWFIIGLSLIGVVAFAITGFLGYTNQAPDSAFIQPWGLFLWLCALLITLQASILRDQSLRSRLIATLVISVLAILIIFVTNFGNALPDVIRQLLSQHVLLAKIGGSALTYTIANFGLIAVFWFDSVRRWIRRSQGLPPNPRVDIGIDNPRAVKEEDLPSQQELISGDLMAGAVLTLLLSFLFRADLLNFLIHPNGFAITGCTVSWPIGTCLGDGGGISNPPTLTFINVIQTLIYLPLGLLVLALSATLSGLGAVSGVNARKLDDSDLVLASKQPNKAATGAVAADVTETVIDTLRSALDRRLRLLARNFVLAMRYIAWPGLILLGTYGLAQVSISIEAYLHNDKDFSNFVFHALPAVGWGVAAVLGVVFSSALMLFRWRVAENSLQFLGLIGFVVLLTYWIFSLALWGFNKLLELTGASDRTPFDPPSWTTAISVAALLVFAVLFVVRSFRGPGSGGQKTVPVGTQTGGSPSQQQ
ncbi:MAG TPA: hypothetical protein VGP82_06860 [Ktedonobacterales bacterium]|jgi:hypothetical protein|nr:hypothetical protein [Ktedonobacterales bacterium]